MGEKELIEKSEGKFGGFIDDPTRIEKVMPKPKHILSTKKAKVNSPPVKHLKKSVDNLIGELEKGKMICPVKAKGAIGVSKSLDDVVTSIDKSLDMLEKGGPGSGRKPGANRGIDARMRHLLDKKTGGTIILPRKEEWEKKSLDEVNKAKNQAFLSIQKSITLLEKAIAEPIKTKAIEYFTTKKLEDFGGQSEIVNPTNVDTKAIEPSQKIVTE